MLVRTSIIDVERKPRQCPVCKSSVVDLIYGTGDMTEPEFLFEYRREGIMGGDNIPCRPPIWACSCGCKRFRKVNPNETDAPVKVKMLKDIKRKPLTLINFTSKLASLAVERGRREIINHYLVEVTTEYGEKEKLIITAVNGNDAEAEAWVIVANQRIGLEGSQCVEFQRPYGINDDFADAFDCTILICGQYTNDEWKSIN